MFKLALEFKNGPNFCEAFSGTTLEHFKLLKYKNQKLGADYLDSRRKGKLEGF